MAELLIRLMAVLPRPLLQWLGVVVGWGSYLLNTRAAKVTRVNLELCASNIDLQVSDRLVRDSLIETAKTLFETPAVWLGHERRIDSWISQVHGEPLLLESLSADTGLLVLLPHLGNWELFNVFFRRYGRMTALYQPPRQPWMQPLMAEVRQKRGNIMVPTSRKGLATLYRELDAGGTVVVLPDQVPASGEFAPFCGEMALTDSLSDRLVAKTGARVLAVAMIRGTDGRFDAHVLEADPDMGTANGPADLAAVNRTVEKTIRLSPAQYQWEYKRFRERPRGETKLYRFNKAPGSH